MRGFQPGQQQAGSRHHSPRSGARGFSPRGFAGGGVVRGPGTGTSDDVEDVVPKGTYIMPADSTAAIGADALATAGQPRGFQPGGGGSLPVKLSNGEYKLPPEQVHAVGVQALEQAKNATHVPVARGFVPDGVPLEMAPEPKHFFANGGLVDDEPRQRRTAFPTNVPSTSIYGRQSAAPAPAPAAPLDAQAQSDRTAVARGLRAVGDVSDTAGRAIADVATMVPRGLAGAYDSAVVRPMRAAGLPAAYLSPSLTPDGADPSSMTPFTDVKRATELAPTAAGAPTAPTATTAPQAEAPSARGFVPGMGADARRQAGDFDRTQVPMPRDFTADLASVPRGLPSGMPEGVIMKTTDANGRPVYSGQNVRGLAPMVDGTGREIAQGGTVNTIGGGGTGAGAYADRQLSAARAAAMARGDLDAVAASYGQGPTGPRAMVVGAEGPVGLRRDPRIAADARAGAAQVQRAFGQDPASRREAAELAEKRAVRGLRVAELNANNARADRQQAIDGRRLAVEETRARQEGEVRGFEIGNAQRRARIQREYDAAKTPEERTALVRQYPDVFGRAAEAEWSPVTLQGGTNAQGNRLESVLGAVNKRTGEMRRYDGQSSSVTSQFEKGAVYVDGQGRRARYTGTGWEPA